MRGEGKGLSPPGHVPHDRYTRPHAPPVSRGVAIVFPDFAPLLSEPRYAHAPLVAPNPLGQLLDLLVNRRQEYVRCRTDACCQVYVWRCV